MQPIQLWLPNFDPAVSSAKLKRDIARAQQAWDGEATIWLCPGLDVEYRWENPPFRATEMALPSETFNRIDVFHIGEHGYLYGRHWFPRFFQRNIRGLLEEWLCVMNGKDDYAIELFTASTTTVNTHLPLISRDKIKIVVAEVQAGPLGTFPLTVARESRHFTLSWPEPQSNLPYSVSPSAESSTYYGEMLPSTLSNGGRDYPVFVSEKVPECRSIPIIDRWPGNLKLLFPYGGGMDALLGQYNMARVASKSQTDLQGALQEARHHAGSSVSSGFAPLYFAWFLPHLESNGIESALYELEGRYGLVIRNANELIDSPDFSDLRGEPTPVTRCVGVLGLFWALLLQHLESGRSFVPCELCGRVITGRTNKRFCSEKDNRHCFKTRRSRSKRNERARKKSRKL